MDDRYHRRDRRSLRYIAILRVAKNGIRIPSLQLKKESLFFDWLSFSLENVVYIALGWLQLIILLPGLYCYKYLRKALPLERFHL